MSGIIKRFFSLLPILFISVTIFCIFMLFSILSTQKNEVLKAIEKMGADRLVLCPHIYKACDDKRLKSIGIVTPWIEENISYIKRQCKEIKNITIVAQETSIGDMCMVGGKLKSFDEWRRFLPPVYVIGTTPDYKLVQNLELIHGRFINELDMKMKRKVCVIGNTPYQLLGREKIINKKIKLECYPNETFTVIGCLKTSKPFLLPFISDMGIGDDNEAWNFYSSINSTIFIPYTVFQKCTPVHEQHKIFHDIFITITLDRQGDKNIEKNGEELWENLSTADIEKSKKRSKEYKAILGPRYYEILRVKNKILSILQERYGKDKHFLIYPEKRLLETYEEHFHSVNILITMVGGISVIGSIIFILSMMLYSVATRTAEIGIRRAVGARKRDIFFQFLKEGVIITGKGGIGGIVLGLLTVSLLGKYTGWEMVIPWYGLVLSVFAIGIIGIIGGIYPAMKADNIPPAIAVKHE
ncbi:MAG: FtsX-like permease family protein [Candidatus Desantisbacteria bacterium]